MLTREQIVELAKAYEQQADALENVKYYEKKLEALTVRHKEELAWCSKNLAEARAKIFPIEGVIFNLEVQNGNFPKVPGDLT